MKNQVQINIRNMRTNSSHRCLNSVFVFIFFSLILLSGCKNISKTSISIGENNWYLNGKVINKGTPAEGLLMNVRMVNSVFEDSGEAMPEEFRGFDKNQNTENFISKIPEYINQGVNGFTISLQGGMPGYEGAVNTAFQPNGEIRAEYLERIERVIHEIDTNGGMVILTCFYQRQHTHDFALEGKKAIENAVENVAIWIKNKQFTNVVLEISNEYNHGGFLNWKDGDWLYSAEGQVELINLAKKTYPDLLVSTSGLGNGRMDELICKAADFILIHFNGTSHEDIPSRIADLKKYRKPVVCNEDDKKGADGAKALELSVANGCGWGYMNNDQNQYMPFLFEGVQDDPPVYSSFKKVTN